MSLTSDISEIIFATRGVSNVIADYQRIATAEERLQMLQEKAYYAPAGAQRDAAQQAVRDALRQSEQQGLRQAAQEAAYAVSGAVNLIKTEIHWVQEAIAAYTDYGKTIQAVASLSGASLQGSEKFTNMARVLGVSGQQEIREVMRLSKDMQSSKGRGALGQLGINPVGKDTLQTFTEATQKLSQMKDSARKTALEMELFGGRLAVSLQPFLHQSADIIAKTDELSAHIDGRAVAAINHFQQSSNLLGQTILVDVVFPIISILLPAIDATINKLQEIIVVVHKMDEMFHGAFSWGAIVIGIALAAGGIAVAFVAAAKALKVLIALQWVENAALAVRDALSGPVGWAALAVAGVVAATVGVAAWTQHGADGDKTGSDLKESANSFSNSVRDFGASVANFKSWSGIGGSQTPSGLSETDFQFIQMQNMQGAIG